MLTLTISDIIITCYFVHILIKINLKENSFKMKNKEDEKPILTKENYNHIKKVKNIINI